MKTSFNACVSFLVLFIISFQSYATHIIGGELQVNWTGVGTMYEIRLNIYINDKSVYLHQLATESKQTVFFATSVTPSYNNTYINQVDLLLVYNKEIATNSNFCATKEVVETNLLIYTQKIDLAQYLKGYASNTYYITWQNGYRNEIITNLVDPGNAFIALFVQCPNLSFQNSSPSFSPLQNEFFCKGILNQYNMSATDANNDRLQYSLVSPLKAIDPLDITKNADWKPGYGPMNPIPGTVPLTINPNTGILSFNPSQEGVYCFGIKVEEYRGNVKIGEVRKDYQFNVQDCPVNNKPEISFVDASIKQYDTLTINLREQKCFPIYITDIDASSFAYSEILYINPILNGYPSAGFTLPAQVGLNGLRTTYYTDICLDPCKGMKLDQTTYYPMSVIINDNRCPAMYDTLIFTVKVEVFPNTLPTVLIDPLINPQLIKVDSLLQFGVFGSDADVNDLLSLTIFNQAEGMVFQNVYDSSSTISSPFRWQTTCNNLNPGTYTVLFTVSDNSCTNSNTNSIQQTIIVVDNEVSFNDIDIPNLVTPNGDGLNDHYRIPGIPDGNCSTYFKGIEIYNRWGARIFYSTDKLFKWYPDVSDGIYYYTLDFNTEQKNGWIQIIQ